MRFARFAAYLQPRLERWANERPADFQVVKTLREGEGRPEDRGEIYLRRWFICRNRFFNLYLHQMLRDDDAALHDHPYRSVSLCLSDGIEERYTLDPEDTYQLQQYGEDDPNSHRFPKQGDLVYRSSTMAHRLIVHKPAWTLFLTGRRTRTWGFWCPKGWRPWTEYTKGALAPTAAGLGTGTSGVGIGCGEME